MSDFRHRLQYRLGKFLDWVWRDKEPDFHNDTVGRCPHCKKTLLWQCGSCGNIMKWHEYQDMPIWDFKTKTASFRAGKALVCEPCGLKFGFKRLSAFEEEVFFGEVQYMMLPLFEVEDAPK